MRTASCAIVLSLFAAVFSCGCGGAQKEKSPNDPVALLESGNYRAARIAAITRGATSPTDRAVIALSHIGEHPDAEAATRSVQALSRDATEHEAIEASAEMLALLSNLNALLDDERSQLAAEIALGAAGHGPLAASNARKSDALPVERFDLAITVLERLRTALSAAKELSSPRVLAIWNGCYTLLGGAMKGADDYDSWRLYLNVGGLAVIVSDTTPGTDLADALLTSTVVAVETSPLLAVAVRCDLASPFDALRAAIVHKRALAARLERAVEKALACSRGRYAPEPPK